MDTIPTTGVDRAFADYFRCPEVFSRFELMDKRSSEDAPGYFQIGSDLIGYSKVHGAKCASSPSDDLPDVESEVEIANGTCRMPFELTELITNLRFERYQSESASPAAWKKPVQYAYYAIRPLLPVALRRHLQRAWLSGRDRGTFPKWPVDLTVDQTLRWAMGKALQANRVSRIPFVWFWPEGKSACAMMTHDVETSGGLDWCGSLMDINDSFDIKSSFQLIPGARYDVTDEVIRGIRGRGFEVNVHDLKHDGHLYNGAAGFSGRADLINQHAARFASKGFRSGALYRNLEWYGSYEFSYDMSVPNTARLDPQAGGCCTVMPYFVGNILELPVTTIQDYSLFNILGTYSLDMWRQQIGAIHAAHGLISFIVHPDYLNTDKARDAYCELLSYLSHLRKEENLWIALPGEIDTWWRQRNELRIVEKGNGWEIEGRGAERARLAYATRIGQEVQYSLA